MKRLFAVFVLLVLIVSAVLAAPTMAQEVTPEAPPVIVVTPTAPADAPPVIIDQNENPVLLTVLAIVVVLLVLFAGALLFLAHKGYNMLPEWAKDLVQFNQPYIQGQVTAGFDTLDKLSVLTPNTLDDLLVKYGRDFVETRVKQFYGEIEAPTSPPTMANKSPTQSSTNI